MRQLRQRIERLLILLGLLSIIPSARAEPALCPGSSTEFGYTSISDINADITSELTRIQSGATPNGMYTYSLCSNTVFDAGADGPLRPALSNSFFVCGPDGNPSNNCIISGGAVQVEINDSLLTDYPLNEITFLGMQFTGFTRQSISATASFPTQANFRDVTWRDFTSDFVIQQMVNSTAETEAPMTIDISGAAIQDGTAGAVFDNDGGSLRVTNLGATGVTSPALMATSNGGNSFFQDSIVSSSRLDYVTETSGLGAQSVINVQVNDMVSMVNTFRVQDAGSQLSVSGGSSITNNNIAGTRWTAVQAQTGASARIADFTMSGNSGVAFAFSSVGANTRIQVVDSVIEDNVGTADPRLISASGVALSQGTLSVNSTQFNQNNKFTGAILALQASTINMAKSCFTNSESKYVVFVDSTSKYGQSNNFVSGYTSTKCATDSGRLFAEDADSGCFEGSNICTGECSMMSNSTVCLAVSTPTVAPGTPTVSPTTMLPTMEITTEPVPTQRPSASKDTFMPSTANATVMPTVAPGIDTVAPTAGGIDTGAPTTSVLTSPPSVISSPSPAPVETPQPTTEVEPSPTRKPITKSTPAPTACPGVKGASKKTKAPKGSKGVPSKGKGKGSGSKSKHELCPPPKKDDKAPKSKWGKGKGKGGSWSGSSSNGLYPPTSTGKGKGKGGSHSASFGVGVTAPTASKGDVNNAPTSKGATGTTITGTFTIDTDVTEESSEAEASLPVWGQDITSIIYVVGSESTEPDTGARDRDLRGSSPRHEWRFRHDHSQR